MLHVGTQTLQTKRLVLRPFTLADAPAAFENWMSDELVTPFLTWQPYKELSAVRDTLSAWTNAYLQKDFYLWAIVLQETMLPVGCIDARVIDEKAAYMRIGYCLGSKWWGQGLMTEALGAVIKFLFEKPGANRIEARHDPNNPASAGVMKKCGMHYEATLKQAAWSNAGIYDTAVYAIFMSCAAEQNQ